MNPQEQEKKETGNGMNLNNCQLDVHGNVQSGSLSGFESTHGTNPSTNPAGSSTSQANCSASGNAMNSQYQHVQSASMTSKSVFLSMILFMDLCCLNLVCFFFA